MSQKPLDNTVIRVPGDPTHEGRRRRYELLAAVALTIVVLVGTWMQLTLYGVDSWMFIALLNVNGLLMLVVLLLVLRNTIKLIMERRRKVFGARLRTRMVLMFVSLSLFPAVIMFLASNRVVATSVDYWFTNQTENSLQAALDVGRSFYAASAERLRTCSENIVQEMTERQLAWNGQAMSDLLSHKQKEYALIALCAISSQGTTRDRQLSPAFNAVWEQVRDQINWEHVAANHFGSLFWATDDADFVIGILAVNKGRSGYLLTAESIGRGLMNKLDRITRGFEEYAYLKQLKNPLKLSFLLILGVLGLATIFGSIWLGFRLSKQIAAPILALAEGTNRVARGDLDFRLEDTGKDELGLLVESFNRMARDLQQSREGLTRANELLAQQNTTIAERNLYIEAVLDSVATGVITLDASGRVLTVNKAACSIFNTNPRRLVGLNPLNLLPPIYAENFTAMLEALRARPHEHWIRQVDFGVGEQNWKLIIHAVALSDPEGIQAYLAVIEDITELEKMQRLAAWREVARRIAHEIKNPLTPIKLSAQRLAKRFGKGFDDPVFGQCTDLIVRQVERMQDMVEEFSSFAKLPETRLLPGDPGQLLEEVVTMFRTSHGQYDWELDTDSLPRIAMDAEALHRALFNICANAAEALAEKSAATPAGWKGHVRLSACQDPERHGLRLTIEDNGPGLTPKERERLFEPYYSRKKGGTGLGLAIVHSIVKDHRGEINAAASSSGGMTFTFVFPPYAASQKLNAAKKER